MKTTLLVLVLFLASQTASATSPCPPSTSQPCQNNWAAEPITLAFGIDAMIGSIIVSASNAGYIARGHRSSKALLVLGIHLSAFSAALGWTTLGMELGLRAQFPQWSGNAFNAGIGATLVAVSIVDAVLAAVAYSQPDKRKERPLLTVTPWIDQKRTGATLALRY